MSPVDDIHPTSYCYFVEDGNHRVSVARYQGVEMIDAEVTELLPPLVRGD